MGAPAPVSAPVSRHVRTASGLLRDRRRPVRRGRRRLRAIMRASGARGGNVPELPSGTVTFLFTDLEGSTRLWEEHPEAMRPALERHDALLRAAVEGVGGQVVKTTGDGVHAVFDHHPRRARRGGRRPSAALGAEDVGCARTACGCAWVVHTGDAVARDGDYYGPAANRAARLMAIGARRPGPGVARDRGDPARRDCPTTRRSSTSASTACPTSPRPERIFQVVAAGPAREFPPLRRSTRCPATCPASSPRSSGASEREVDSPSALLASPPRHPHRCRWCRQDAARDPGRADIAPAVPRRRLVVRARAAGGATRSCSQVVAATWVCRHAPRRRIADSVDRRACACASSCSSSTTASTWSTPSVELAEGICSATARASHPGHQSRGLGVAGEQVWPLSALDAAVACPTPPTP